MAEASSGTVYVLLLSDTTGTDWKKGTVWDDSEWLNIGPDVTKVIGINPNNTNGKIIKNTTPPAPTFASGVCSFHLTQ